VVERRHAVTSTRGARNVRAGRAGRRRGARHPRLPVREGRGHRLGVPRRRAVALGDEVPRPRAVDDLHEALRRARREAREELEREEVRGRQLARRGLAWEDAPHKASPELDEDGVVGKGGRSCNKGARGRRAARRGRDGSDERADRRVAERAGRVRRRQCDGHARDEGRARREVPVSRCAAPRIASHNLRGGRNDADAPRPQRGRERELEREERFKAPRDVSAARARAGGPRERLALKEVREERAARCDVRAPRRGRLGALVDGRARGERRRGRRAPPRRRRSLPRRRRAAAPRELRRGRA
jgi:hypothetical protein